MGIIGMIIAELTIFIVMVLGPFVASKVLR